MKPTLRGKRHCYVWIKVEIQQKYEAVGQGLLSSLQDISVTATNIEIKLTSLCRGTCALSDDTSIAWFGPFSVILESQI